MNILQVISLMFTMLFSQATPVDLPVRCPAGAQYWTSGCSHNGYQLPGFPTQETWTRQEDTPEIFYGRAIYYHPGIMHATANYRGFSQEYLNEFDCLASGFFINDVGRVAWLLYDGEPYRCLIVDNAHPRDLYEVLVYNRESIEVEWTFARDVLQSTEKVDGYHPHPITVVAYQVEEPTPEEWRSAQRLDEYLASVWETSRNGEPHGYIRVHEDQSTEYKISAPNKKWLYVPGSLWVDDYTNGDEVVTEILYDEHIVKSGETLSHIAKKYYGSASEESWKKIYDANTDVLGNPHYLKIGTLLMIPISP